MRVCLAYDCLFPWTIGGAERWYRDLGERLAKEGHQVTYLTLRQWDEPPQIDGVTVIAVGPRMALYSGSKRRLLPPIIFGIGVLMHLLRHGRSYDVVHACSFPYFSLLAAGVARWIWNYRINCDWYEVWSAEYWREYLGPLGRVGLFVQWLCARVPQKAYSYSRLHEERMRALGLRDISRLTGLFRTRGEPQRETEAGAPPTIVYAGRFIPEKRVELLVEALAHARRIVPELRAELIGDGPTRGAVIALIDSLGLQGVASCPGFVDSAILEKAMSSATCLVQPSSREGYGLVVVEAAYRGVPIIVMDAPDNAASELVSEGRNGFVVPDADAERLASAIISCVEQGPALRRSTAEWFDEHESQLALESSLAAVIRDFDRIEEADQAPTLAAIKIG